MTNENKLLESLFNLCKKLNNLEDPNLVAEELLKQPQLPNFLMEFINSPYYNFSRKIDKKENILYILGYKLLSAIVLALIIYIKYKEKIKEPLKEAIREGFKYAESLKNEEAFLIGFISKIKKYIFYPELEEILKKANFPLDILIKNNKPKIQSLNQKDLENIEKYTNILLNLIESYAKKLRD